MSRRAPRIPWLAVLLVLALLGAGAWWALGPVPSIHVVERGDTLSKLARRYDVTVEQLRDWNGIDGDLIEVGQWLWMWPATVAPSGEIASGDPEGTERAGAAGASEPGRRRKPVSAPLPAPAPADTGGAAPTFRALEMPPLKRCLAGPVGSALEDADMVASQGLDQGQASRALSAFSPELSRCLAGTDAEPTGTLELELLVACSGRVERVEVVERADWPHDVAACLADTLRYAPFPAHDLPDGDVVLYPLRRL